MSRPGRWKVGDVFLVPIDEVRYGLGQVVGMYRKQAYYFAIYDVVVADPSSVDLDAAIRELVVFLALSLDAKLAAGHWPIVGHRDVPGSVRLPAYKEVVGGPGRVEVVDYSGNLRRPASMPEAESLPNRKVVAPVRLERALRARHGQEPWTEAFSELAPEESMTTERLFR